jgi:hypothetical protein
MCRRLTALGVKTERLYRSANCREDQDASRSARAMRSYSVRSFAGGKRFAEVRLADRNGPGTVSHPNRDQIPLTGKNPRKNAAPRPTQKNAGSQWTAWWAGRTRTCNQIIMSVKPVGAIADV